MLVVDVKADFSGVLRKLEALSSDVSGTVTARALNRIADQTKTQSTRDIASIYNLTSTKVRERIYVSRAFAKTRLQVEVEVKSKFGRRSTNLITFGARELVRGGVSVKIRRDKPSLRGKSWFILTNKRTGGTFVAKRTGSGRGDIDPVRTVDVGQMFTSKRITESMLRLIRQRFPKEVDAQMRYALMRFGK